MTDKLLMAKKILLDENLTCVIAANNKILRYTERGIKPLLKIIEDKTDVKNASVADKVIGKAAAFLYCIMGVKEIYAITISEPALSTLESAKIQVYFNEKVPLIKNRQGTGLCPMESAVIGETDEKRALKILQKKLKDLSTEGKK